MRYVLDCSVVVKWFVPEPLSEIAEQVLARHESGEISLVAPNTIVAEFGHSLRKHVIGRFLQPERALSSLGQFLGMKFDRAAAEPLAENALRLAIAHSATFYDALYLALAERADIVVLTADDRMATAFSKLGRTVLLADFK